MQKVIAKYGAAAHLAFLAVAPLFLFPFFKETTVAVVMLWLTIPAVLWSVMEPSLRHGEMLHNARFRVLRAVVRDPLTWGMLTIVVLTGVRALNTGIGLSYDAEHVRWFVSPATFEILPGSVGSTGFLPFSVATALFVLVLSCRHALGRSARMAFLLVGSSLAGVSAAIAVIATGVGLESVRVAARCSESASFFLGTAYGLHLLGGTVALVEAFERKWNWMMPFFIFAIGGTGAGLYSFSTPFAFAVFAGFEILTLAYVFFYSSRTLPTAGEFKLLVVFGIALTLGGFLVVAVLPPEYVSVRLLALKDLTFFSEDFLKLRAALSAVAVKSWLEHLWIGTGLGSYPLDFRFAAGEAEWALAHGEVLAVPNAWWQLLAERGIVGVLTLGLPVGFMFFTYGRRLFGSLPISRCPHPACLLTIVVTVALAVVGLFDCSFLRAEAMLVAGSMLALSANSFVGKGKGRHG